MEVLLDHKLCPIHISPSVVLLFEPNETVLPLTFLTVYVIRAGVLHWAATSFDEMLGIWPISHEEWRCTADREREKAHCSDEDSLKMCLESTVHVRPHVGGRATLKGPKSRMWLASRGLPTNGLVDTQYFYEWNISYTLE
ncbi:hypothetical protein NDU88_007570 [Pleurodeles waltl]|uniref:Uncharacterized protein n=1 Tax=Pleurodeles waltl TaxID=8319 RepID=A0AAV7PQM2_PLEWA|nr:hypothetical protein NDU88_007570 [Pleurodeles waltl]